MKMSLAAWCKCKNNSHDAEKKINQRGVQSHVYPARCLPPRSFGRRTCSSSQKLCFIMNEWWRVSPRGRFNWHGAEELWCTRRCGGGERRAPHYCSLSSHTQTHARLSFGAAEAAGRARQPCDGSSRDKAWAERRAEDVIKSNTPSLSQSWGNPLKKHKSQRWLSVPLKWLTKR